MSLSIAEFKETIEVNRVDMSNNRMLVNEIIVNDLMMDLGYNKRKDKSVKRLYNNTLDWEVLDSNIKLAVKVFCTNDEDTESEMQSVFSVCSDKRISIILVTNGETLEIMRFNKETLEYNSVTKISLTEDLDVEQETIIDAISKDNYNLSIIDEILKSTKVSYEEVVNSVVAHRNEIESSIADWMGVTSEDIVEHCDTIFNKINGYNETSEVVVESNDTAVKDIEEKLDKLEAELVTKNEKIEELEEKLNTKEEEITSLNNKLNSNSNELVNNDSNSEDYVKQIEELTTNYSDAITKLDDANKEIESLKEEIQKLSGAERERAVELLSIIEDSPELERSYVAVINTELLQFEQLHTFVGRLLQKLYELKSFEASQYIFNADVFKLVQPSERNDLIMNNKAYDINLDGISEDEVLNKLRVLFSHFDGLIFECKKIGNEGFNDGFSNSDETDWESIDETDFSTENNEEAIFIEDEETEEVNENSSENIDEADLFGDDDEEITIEDDMSNLLLVQNLVNIDSLVWTEENVRFNTIKYVGSQEVTFAINIDINEIGFDGLLCKCIDAILALEIYSGNSTIISELKQKDFSFINNSIKLYTEEYRNYPRINGTRYAVVDVASVQQVATILLDICNTLNISTDNKYIYFNVDTDSKFIIDNYGYSEDSVQLRETEYYTSTGNEQQMYAVIKGDMFNSVMVTKNSLRAHESVLMDTAMVKTKYLARQISSIEDVQDIIGAIAEEAFNSGIEIDCSSIGNVLGSEYKIASYDEDEVSPDSKCVMIGGKALFCSRMENWQVPHALIKIHTALFNNTAIALKTKINVDAVNYYGSEYETTEPSLSLAIRSFVDYITASVKNN